MQTGTKIREEVLASVVVTESTRERCLLPVVQIDLDRKSALLLRDYSVATPDVCWYVFVG